MRVVGLRILAPSLVLVWLALTAAAARSTPPLDLSRLPPAAEREVDFARDIQPIFRAACHSCHGAEKHEGGLRLDERRRAMAGGDHGPVIREKKSSESRLIHLITGLDENTGRMPPEGEGRALTAEQIGILRAWIDQGAVWPDKLAAASAANDHWSLKRVARPPLPHVVNEAWSRQPIDYFILARLEKEQIEPSPEVDRLTLMRRVHFDLTGLPPTPREVDAFLADDRPVAYERLVDRLLASPHFGERWGRRWLDLARYADSDGYEKDKPRPFAWRYRHWVIGALNADMPFDRFTIEQLAGDLLPHPTAETKAATGFHRNTLHNAEGGVDAEEDRVKKTVDRTNTTGTVWLGLTVGCAQCHSHKYDPITQREYFQLYAFFNSLSEADVESPLPELAGAAGVKAQAVAEIPKPRVTRIHQRGDFLSPGDEVPSATPEVLPSLSVRDARPDRLDLARWLVTEENPLTARVAVNRLWQEYFGRGLVGSSDDFGRQGDPPSHPELLDWLAQELMDCRWNLKPIHRLIVTSAVYRQSSTVRAELREIDPENILLARQSRLRLEAEIIRDAGLAASGLLDSRIGGPSVRPPQPAEYSKLTYANSANWPESKGADRYRRGLYTFFQRTSPYPMLATFDAPDANECCTRRWPSNTSLQALTLWNDVVFFEFAQALARRVLRNAPVNGPLESEDAISVRVEFAFRTCLVRSPDAEERAALASLYRRQLELCNRDPQAAAAIAGKEPFPPDATAAQTAAWVLVARAILNLDEFITRE
jgi:mono/diheme cytochrome c family protein